MNFLEIWGRNIKFDKILVNGKETFTGTAKEIFGERLV